MNTKDKKPGLVAKGIFGAAKWLSPIGMIKVIYQKELSNNEKLMNESSPTLKKTRTYVGMVVSSLFMIGAIWTIFSSSSESTLKSGMVNPFMVLMIAVAAFSAFKLALYYKISQTLEPKNKNNDEVNPPANSNFNMNEEAGSILLFRITVFKYAYALAALFSLSLLLKPSNIVGLKSLLSHQGFNYGTMIVTIGTSLCLTLIFLVKYMTAVNDLKLIRRHKAQPNAIGFVTINNNVYQIVNLIILTLTIAFVGDKLIVLTATKLNVYLAGTFPLVIMALMVGYSVIIFRSAVALSGLQTGNQKEKINILDIFRFKICRLPIPNENDPVLQTLNSNMVVGLTLFVSIAIASYTGVLSLFALIPVVMLLGIVLAIDEFHKPIMEASDE